MNFIKNHWKKLTFAGIGTGYGVYYFWWQYEVTTHMRKICKEVVEYAEKQPGAPKRVLVVMNPVAKGKKTEKMFQKYCEPLLHLAGYSVEILKTNYVGHAKSLIENLQIMPDVLVVAGGDGTSSEVVTGLMRRKHGELCPLVFLPLGNKNETALKYMHATPDLSNSLEYTKSLSNTLLPMIHEKYRPESIIKFDVLDGGNESKAVYGLTRFSWGLLRDIESIKDKYWYFGYLRHNAAALFNAFSSKLNWKLATEIEYTPPCEGCVNCLVSTNTAKPTKSFFMKMLREAPAKDNLQIKRVNEKCNQSTQSHIEVNQLNITSTQNTNNVQALQTTCIANLIPGIEFVKNLPNVTKNKLEPSVVLESRTIQLTPTNAKEEQYFTIDGEEYEVRPVKNITYTKCYKNILLIKNSFIRNELNNK